MDSVAPIKVINNYFVIEFLTKCWYILGILIFTFIVPVVLSILKVQFSEREKSPYAAKRGGLD